MSSQQTPAVGDKVGVPWGLDVLEGQVLRTYETGTGIRVVVSVDVPGADDESQSRTITLRITDLLPVGEGHELEPPGSWVNEYQFSKAVQAALERAVSRLSEGAEVENEPSLGGQRPDAIIRLGDHLIVVETKATSRTSVAIEQLSAYLREVRNRNPDALVAGMLVLQSKPEDSASRTLRDLGVTTVNWKTPRDDSRLAAAVNNLLAA